MNIIRGIAEKANSHLHPIVGITINARIVENADPSTQNICNKLK